MKREFLLSIKNANDYDLVNISGGTNPVKKRIYEETNRFIERWTRWIDLAAAFWTPTMLTTLAVYNVSVIYLTRRLTDEDYALTYPFW